MVIPWAMALMFLITDMLHQYSGRGGFRLSAISSQLFGIGFSKMYQGRGVFRGRLNLCLIIETLEVRLRPVGAKWRFNLWPAVVCVLLSFYFLRSLRWGFRFSFQLVFRQGLRSGTGLYTTPAVVPNPAAVKVTATAAADSTKSGSATVSVETPTGSGTSQITVTATAAGGTAHGDLVTLIVQ